MKRPVGTRPGMSLVEILITVLVFSLALIPIFDLLTKTGSQARFNRESILAVQLAVELVDQICGMPFTVVPTCDGRRLSEADDGALLSAGRIESRLVLSPLPEGFERTLTVTQPSPWTKLVRCTVSWGGAPRGETTWQSLMEWSL